MPSFIDEMKGALLSKRVAPKSLKTKAVSRGNSQKCAFENILDSSSFRIYTHERTRKSRTSRSRAFCLRAFQNEYCENIFRNICVFIIYSLRKHPFISVDFDRLSVMSKIRSGFF